MYCTVYYVWIRLNVQLIILLCFMSVFLQFIFLNFANSIESIYLN